MIKKIEASRTLFICASLILLSVILIAIFGWAYILLDGANNGFEIVFFITLLFLVIIIAINVLVVIFIPKLIFKKTEIFYYYPLNKKKILCRDIKNVQLSGDYPNVNLQMNYKNGELYEINMKKFFYKKFHYEMVISEMEEYFKTHKTDFIFK